MGLIVGSHFVIIIHTTMILIWSVVTVILMVYVKLFGFTGRVLFVL